VSELSVHACPLAPRLERARHRAVLHMPDLPPRLARLERRPGRPGDGRDATDAAPPLIAKQAKANQKQSLGPGAKGLQKSANLSAVDTRQEVARSAGVSHDTIAKAKVIAERAPQAVKDKLRRGETTIHREYSAIVQPEKRQKRLEAIEQSAAPTSTAGQRFPVIYADPPWRYEHVKTENRAIETRMRVCQIARSAILTVLPSMRAFNASACGLAPSRTAQ